MPHSEPRTTPDATPPAEPQELRWTVWPLRDRFANLCWAPVLMAALGGLVAWRLESGLLGGLTAAALAMTLPWLWLPVTYAVTRDHLEIRCLGRRRRIGWSRVRAVRSRSGGATLYAKSIGPSGKPAWSSVRVVYPAADDSVAAEVRRRVRDARTITAA